MAEAVLATALAIPVLFAFAELRGNRLLGTSAESQRTDTLHDSSGAAAAEQPLPPVRVVLLGGSDTKTSAWESAAAVLIEALSLATHDASENTVEGEAAPETSDTSRAGESLRPPTGAVSLNYGADRSPVRDLEPLNEPLR